MAKIPTTSITLLKAISGDAACVRWRDFLNAYDAPMRAFLQARYPNLEADDIIQDTLMALVQKLPNYHYVPDERGHFHNYLMGVVKHKALDALRKSAKRSRMAATLSKQADNPSTPDDTCGDDTWRENAARAAIDQLLADPSVNPTHREIFRHLVIDQEKPEEVADLFGITRGNIDVIKNRMIKRLQKLVQTMTD